MKKLDKSTFTGPPPHDTIINDRSGMFPFLRDSALENT